MTITDQFEELSKDKFLGASGDIEFVYFKAEEWDTVEDAIEAANEEYSSWMEEGQYYEPDGTVELSNESCETDIYSDNGYELWYLVDQYAYAVRDFGRLRLRNG